jgi:hypothetical protein
MKNKYLVFITLLILLVSACSKDSASTTPQFPGLWIGTYATTVNPGLNQFFSFSIFPDGSLTYKSKDATATYFATGTWTLTGNSFAFTVTVLNAQGNIQTGAATYSNGTLTNGTVVDNSTNSRGTWTMTRVN